MAFFLIKSLEAHPCLPQNMEQLNLDLVPFDVY